uniref:CS domain-containing protein n=1 Tax=Clastoptera arizonana TaxID=38151 RepID=A0A1B6CNN1_9HEMI
MDIQGSSVNNISVKHEWYQTETHLTIVFLIKNMRQDNVIVNYFTRSLQIIIKINVEDTYNHVFNFFGSICPEQCSYKILQSKVEVKLKKNDGLMWPMLEENHKVSSNATNKLSKNWDKVIKDEVENEQEGDSVNNLFQKIYGEGDDECKKAMIKSFTESNGTVLSTNWNEISKNKVESKPPDGMEWKKWDE